MTSYRALAPLAVAFSIAAAPSASAHDPDWVADLVENVKPATVSISVKQAQAPAAAATPPQPFQLPPGTPFEDFFRNFRGDEGAQTPTPAPSSVGSGFVVDGDQCHIVTNRHVVEGGGEIKVTFPSGETYNATVLGTDAAVDLAVLDCDATQPVPEVSFGDSSRMREGSWVMAIGNPLGLSNSVSQGIVSYMGRDIGSGPYDDYIQTDTAINRGNSGGALFNKDGEVIGINTAIFSPNGGSIGIGFAIPSNLATGVVDQLIAHGEVRRGGFGAQISNISPEKATELGLADNKGVLVQGVVENGPAANAGLMTNDVITSFNGRTVTNTRELMRVVAETPIGSEVEVTYFRGGVEMTAAVTVADRKAVAEESEPAPVAPVQPGPAAPAPAPAPAP